MSETTTETSWAQRVRDARGTKEGGALAYEQTIRDAHHIGGMSAKEIAEAMGIKDRTQITKYLRSERATGAPAVRLPVTLSLHGRGNGDGSWAAMRDGLAARGWYETDDNQAWHLSRAGAVVVRVFWSSDRDDVIIELVRAVHSQPTTEPIVTRLVDHLPTMAGVRLMHEHPEVADFAVQQYDDFSQTWKTLAERTIGRPMHTAYAGEHLVSTVDTEAILGRVAALIDRT